VFAQVSESCPGSSSSLTDENPAIVFGPMKQQWQVTIKDLASGLSNRESWQAAQTVRKF
jgi:hypothetical protein